MSFSPRYTYAKVNENDDEELQEVQMTEAPPMSEMTSQEPPAAAPEVPADPAASPPSESSAAPPAVAAPPSFSSSSSNPNVPQAHDSVFSNTTPFVDGPPKYEEDHLPAYNEVVDNSGARSVFTTVTLSSSDPGVFMGRRVGNGWIFLFSMLVSWICGPLGFFCVYMMSQTHAGKTGARSGFGLMLIHVGYYVRKYALMGETFFEDDSISSDELNQMTIWISFFSMFLGWFLFLRGLLDYFRIKNAARMISME